MELSVQLTEVLHAHVAPVCIELDLDSYDGDWRHVARFRGRSGWLTVAEAQLSTRRYEWNTTLVAACDEWGNPVPTYMAPNLLACACSLPEPCDELPPTELEQIINSEKSEIKRRWVRENNKALKELEADTYDEIVGLEADAKRRIATRDAAIADLRRRRRMPLATLEERAILGELISELEREQEAIADALASQRATLREHVAVKERELMRRLEIKVSVEPLYYVNWRSAVPSARQAPLLVSCGSPSNGCPPFAQCPFSLGGRGPTIDRLSNG
jgi:hypothetical protein